MFNTMYDYASIIQYTTDYSIIYNVPLSYFSVMEIYIMEKCFVIKCISIAQKIERAQNVCE